MRYVCSLDTSSRRTEMILFWYRRNGRVLPWRSEVSPYHVWLSEIMLQQTRVETVVCYYERFLAAFPDIESLAAAPEDQILKLWEGLGYYSRIRNMQKAARLVLDRHSGFLPDSRDELMKLPGIGEYTSAAIASIAFGEAVPAVDSNLLRVFARMTEYSEDIKSEASKQAAFRFFLPMINQDALSDTAESVLKTIARKTGQTPNLPGTVNQALMDLGATVCLANTAPRCEDCPWEEFCEAHQQGRELDFPKKIIKKPRTIEEVTVFILLYDGKIALRRRPEKGLLAGMYELPNKKGTLDEAKALHFATELGFSPIRIKKLPPARHVFTHREWHMTGYEIRADELTPFLPLQTGTEDARQTVFLANKQEIRDCLSVPSAFSAYLSLYL